MNPATIAGTLVQQTAEVLAVVTLAQLVRPGAPVMYGSFASNVDMLSGAPALGTPEYTKSAFASGQIARRLGIPLRSSNTTSSNTPGRLRTRKPINSNNAPATTMLPKVMSATCAPVAVCTV